MKIKAFGIEIIMSNQVALALLTAVFAGVAGLR